LSLWLPGDAVMATPAGSGFLVPAGAELVVRVRYRKTWQYERMPMSDRSTLGLYFAEPAAAAISTITASNGAPATLARRSRAVAIYVDDTAAERSVTVTATTPGGRRDELIAFHPRPGWARRYWYAQPIDLPRGTIIRVRSTPAPARVVLNVID
jgi:hypothetical protein